MSFKMIYFIFLILSVCLLEIKSDISHIANNRQVVDPNGQLVQDGRARSPVTIEQIQPAIPQTQVIAREYAIIQQLGSSVDANTALIKYAQEQLPTELNRQEQDTFFRLKRELDNVLAVFQEQSVTESVTQEQRGQNRRLLAQTLQALNSHLERMLARYLPLQRADDIATIEKYSQTLDYFRKRENAERTQEQSEQDQRAQNKRDKLYRKIDKLENLIRNRMQIIKGRHARKLPIDAEHITHVNKMKSLYIALGEQMRAIDNRRELDKQNPIRSQVDKRVLQQRVIQKVVPQEHLVAGRQGAMFNNVGGDMGHVAGVVPQRSRRTGGAGGGGGFNRGGISG